MSIYAVGDVHGCMRTLEDLLSALPWDPAEDHLWMVGDLVNRGPNSRVVLQWASHLERKGRLTAVLGNHDLALLASHCGVRDEEPDDTFQDVLAAPDAAQLCDWLRRRPLLVRCGSDCLVHAGILPGWSLDTADRLARQVELRLARNDFAESLERVFSRNRARAVAGVSSGGEEDSALSVFTRLRLCDPAGRMLQGFTGPPEASPPGAQPWFALRPPQEGVHFVFGHWAALGLRLGDLYSALDDGCVYGRTLAAIRLEDRTVYRVESRM
ncbi:MAG TPA: symmetrical bis(5'-nucleosyl)-tetraphosphatase [Acidobacteriota bacterium]|nr:symmetrical bis(5'-nucleosyl)-tetraphosphatase [Acidobacteriota bacterium]